MRAAGPHTAPMGGYSAVVRPGPSRSPCGIHSPRLGATTYAVVCYAAVQFMLGSASYFAAHQIPETDLYFVQRLSSLARVIVVGMAALGSGVTGTAAGVTRRPAPRWHQHAALARLPGFPAGPGRACSLGGAAWASRAKPRPHRRLRRRRTRPPALRALSSRRVRRLRLPPTDKHIHTSASPPAGIASAGQLALAVQIAVGISKGELDPNAPRTLEEGRKKLELEKVFAMMTGGGKKV